jgi:hypothetical protein
MHTTTLLLLALVYQIPSPTSRHKEVVVPREYAPAVVVYQPECPLKLEFAQLRMSTEGGSAGLIRYSNQSGKAIRSYKVAYIMTGGGGASWSDEGVLPLEDTIPEPYRPSFDEIVPLTPQLRQKLALSQSLKGVWMIMVVRVEFIDGTTYSDESLYAQLREYLSSVPVTK